MKRALIVDDVVENRYMLRVLLEGHGYAVSEAAHGVAALDSARLHRPDIVVSDLMMPVLDGYALLRAWKADADFQGIPFVVYTATYTEPSDARLAHDLGADAFIIKPAEPDVFLAQLEEMLERAHAGELDPPRTPRLDDEALLVRHNDALVKKLAKKGAELEATNRALESDIARRRILEAHAEQLVAELQGRKLQLEQALSVARMGVWFWDLERDQFDAVEGHGPITGLGTGERPTDGTTLLALVQADDREVFADAIDRAKRGEPCDVEFRVTDPRRGLARWVALRGRCLRSDAGRALALTGLDQDVTERKYLEERVRQVQKLEATGQLAGGIAHDFNNLLTAIIGNTELIRAEARNPEIVEECVRDVLNAAQRGKDLTRRILTFSRPQAQRLEPTSLQLVLGEAERLLRATLPAGIELRFEIARDVPLVLADASQLHQVIVNLITNARQAIWQDVGRIETTLVSCDVDGAMCEQHPELRPQRYAHLRVRDTGVGMDARTLEHMFEPFFTTKAPGVGAGLGLSVVHAIVSAHQGAIFAESEPGRGTTFHVLLPTSTDARTAPSRPPEPEPSVVGQGQRVLILDDEVTLVRVARRFLEYCGFRIEGFTSALEALQAFRVAPDRYDAIVTDYSMPGMSGLAFAQEVLRIRPDMRIALVSGYIRPEDAARARLIGLAEVLAKPYRVEELGQLVLRLLPTTARAGEGAASQAASRKPDATSRS